MSQVEDLLLEASTKAHELHQLMIQIPGAEARLLSSVTRGLDGAIATAFSDEYSRNRAAEQKEAA